MTAAPRKKIEKVAPEVSAESAAEVVVEAVADQNRQAPPSEFTPEQRAEIRKQADLGRLASNTRIMFERVAAQRAAMKAGKAEE